MGKPDTIDGLAPAIRGVVLVKERYFNGNLTVLGV